MRRFNLKANLLAFLVGLALTAAIALTRWLLGY